MTIHKHDIANFVAPLLLAAEHIMLEIRRGVIEQWSGGGWHNDTYIEIGYTTRRNGRDKQKLCYISLLTREDYVTAGSNLEKSEKYKCKFYFTPRHFAMLYESLFFSYNDVVRDFEKERKRDDT